MNVLIIDDDAFLRKMMGFMLLDLRHTVTAASNGQEALNLLRTNARFDIIFCDVMMPVLTGPGFLLMLKKLCPGRLPVTVMMSGAKLGEDFMKKLGVKYDHFIHKPLDAVKVRQLLDQVSAGQPDPIN